MRLRETLEVNRPIAHPRALAIAAALAVALLAPTTAQAAKLKIGGGAIAVDDYGVAAIKVKNPNRSAAKGTLTLQAGGARIGSHRFRIPARRSKTVSVTVVADDARGVLAAGQSLRVVALAKAKGKGTARKSLTLTYPGATAGGPTGGEGPGGGAPAGNTPGIPDGTTFRGTTDQGESFEFMKIAGDLIEPLSFRINANCIDSRDASSTFQIGHILLPGKFPLGSDGGFSGEGTKSGIGGGFGSAEIRYTFSGTITGDTAQGKVGMHWETLGFSTYPVVTTWQIFCGGEVTWSAQRQ